jgi:hypothetical protein
MNDGDIVHVAFGAHITHLIYSFHRMLGHCLGQLRARDHMRPAAS